MAKFLYHKEDTPATKAPGVKVGVLFPVEKVRGWSLKFENQKLVDGKWVDVTGEKMMEVLFGDSMLITPNKNKREGVNPATKKPFTDPEFVVYAYPDAKPYVKKA